MTRRTLAFAFAAPLLAHDEDGDPGLNKVALIHGSTVPFAVAGFRMGQAALKLLKLSPGSLDADVVLHSPRELRSTAILDGLQAATGASLGNLNLSHVTSPQTFIQITNRKTNQQVRLELTAAFVKGHPAQAPAREAAAGARLIAVPEADIFQVKK